ncbi:MAG: hypothetical protein JSW00_02310 [Thermoplasmata archaeon]|nr:MAG: hypothetical protein JSW00_02310 [Thermoplasmata archaeon]
MQQYSALDPHTSSSSSGNLKLPIIIGIIIAAIVIIAIVSIIFLGDDGSKSSNEDEVIIKGITINSQETPDGLKLTAFISADKPSKISGQAKITITQSGSTVYTNNNWDIEDNTATITIPYNQFVVDNGDYNINVEFKGASDEITHSIDFVLKNVSITISDNIIVDEQPQFNLKIEVSGANSALPGDSEIRIASIEHEDGIHSITSGIGTWIPVEGNPEYEQIINYDVSGNYTITIDIKNNEVKDSSSYASYSADDKKLINAAPDSKFTWEDEDGDNTVSTGEEVDFDGGISIDDGDLVYHWTITYSTEPDEPGAIVHTDEDEQMTYTFSNIGYYGISLTVKDAHDEVDTHSIIIEVQI